MVEVNISCGKLCLALPVNKNGNMDMSTLKGFFKETEGLVYSQDGITHGLTIMNDEIVLNPEVKDYDVYSSINMSHDHTESAKSCKKNKQKRIEEIMRKLKTYNKENTGLKENLQEAVSSDKQKKSEIKTQRKVKQSKEKKIHVGWMHRETLTDKYRQMKAPVGGNKVLHLDVDTGHVANNILNLAVQEFSKDEFVSDLLKSCKIILGFFNGIEILQFLDETQQPCNLWEFCKSQSISPYRLRLYILSTVQDRGNVDEVNDEDTCIIENVENGPKVTNHKSELELNSKINLEEMDIVTSEVNTVTSVKNFD